MYGLLSEKNPHNLIDAAASIVYVSLLHKIQDSVV